MPGEAVPGNEKGIGNEMKIIPQGIFFAQLHRGNVRAPQLEAMLVFLRKGRRKAAQKQCSSKILHNERQT